MGITSAGFTKFCVVYHESTDQIFHAGRMLFDGGTHQDDIQYKILKLCNETIYDLYYGKKHPIDGAGSMSFEYEVQKERDRCCPICIKLLVL